MYFATLLAFILDLRKLRVYVENVFSTPDTPNDI